MRCTVAYRAAPAAGILDASAQIDRGTGPDLVEMQAPQTGSRAPASPSTAPVQGWLYLAAVLDCLSRRWPGLGE